MDSIYLTPSHVTSPNATQGAFEISVAHGSIGLIKSAMKNIINREI
jgi:hypothetical protein